MRNDTLTSDPREREDSERVARERQLREFLEDATRDVQRMRGLAVRLEASHSVAWSEVQNLAHNLAARAATLKLGVLNACARELESLADEKLSGAPADAFMIQCVSSAIEAIAVELEALKRPR